MSKRKFIKVTWIPRKQMVDALIQLVGGLSIAIAGLLIANLLASCSTTPPTTYKLLEDFEGETFVCPDEHDGLSCHPIQGI